MSRQRHAVGKKGLLFRFSEFFSLIFPVCPAFYQQRRPPEKTQAARSSCGTSARIPRHDTPRCRVKFPRLVRPFCCGEKSRTYFVLVRPEAQKNRQRKLPLPVGEIFTYRSAPVTICRAKSQMRPAAPPSNRSCWRRTISAHCSGSASRAAARAAASWGSWQATLMPWAEK